MLQMCSLLAVSRHHAKRTGNLACYLAKNQGRVTEGGTLRKRTNDLNWGSLQTSFS